MRLRAAASAAPSRSSGGVDPAASGSSPSAGARRKEEAAAVRAALARLSDAEEREVVRLRFFESLSFREVAARLGLTYDQVRERFHVGMQRLEKEMRR